MKKLILSLFLVLFMSSLAYSQDYVEWTGNLASSATAKYDRDTTYIDFSGFTNFPLADSGVVIITIDSLYRSNPDSVGRVASVQLRYVPIHRIYRGGTYIVNDTLSTGGAILEDSLLSVGDARRLSFPLEHSEYMFIIEYSFNDTSNVFATTATNYFAEFILKKKLDYSYVALSAFVDSLSGNIHIIVVRWTFIGDSTNIENARIDTLSITDWIAGQPDLNLNPTALGDVKLFGGVDSLGAGVDGRIFKIHRNATGEVDSLEFYILANTKSYIEASGSLELEAAADITFNSTYGIYVFEHQNSTGFIINTDLSTDQTVLKIREASGNQIIIGGDGDYDHPLQEQATIFIQGAKDPDSSNQYHIHFYHDSSGGVIETGVGIGAGLTPTEIENYISFRPRGVEAMKIDSAGVVTFDSSIVVARSVTGSEFINASKMFIGENPIDKLKQVTHKEGTEIGDWAEIDHEKLPEGVKVPIVKQFFKDRKNGEEVWKPDIYSHINTLLIPILPVSEEDSLGIFYREESTGMYYFSKKEYIDSKYELINKQSYGESLTGIVDIMRNAIIELKAENDLLKERISKLEIQ